MSENSIFKVDSLTVNGQAMSIEDGSAQITGAVGFTNSPVPAASGPDGETSARVPRTIVARILFKRNVNPDELAAIQGARIVLKDSRSPRRCIATNCSFGSIGNVGAGPVDITFNVLDPYQWV